MALHRIIVTGMLAVFISSSISACGGATNNDQGASFQAVGWQKRNADGDPEDSTGMSATLYTDGEASGLGSMKLSYLKFQNNMREQYIILKKIVCDYTIPSLSGHSLPVLRDEFPEGAVLGSIADEENSSGGTANEEYGARRQSLEFTVYSDNLIQYLNLNQNLIPKPPFTITPSCWGVGVTEAGDVMESNRLSYYILVYEPSDPNSVDPINQGPGTGGTLDSYDASDSTAATTTNTQMMTPQ